MAQAAQSACMDVSVLKLAPFGQRGGEFGCYELALDLPETEGWKNWRPGQFVMIKPESWGLDPLWGRPFSICRVADDSVRLFFQVVGRGTSRLASIEQGERVAMWGPLGNGFEVQPETPTLILCGGVGVAPFVGYVLNHPRPENVFLLFGHRLPIGCYPFEALAETVSAENFPDEKPGDLDAFVERMDGLIKSYKAGLILACGPKPFLAAVQRLCTWHGVRAQLSLENKMACGVGACMGCACPDGKGGNRIVCQDGPVFWSDEVDLQEAKP